MTSSRIHRIFHTKSDRFNKSQLWLKRFVPIRARQTSIRATVSEALKQNNQVNELFYVLVIFLNFIMWQTFPIQFVVATYIFPSGITIRLFNIWQLDQRSPLRFWPLTELKQFSMEDP